jgi:hypothetical protein
MKKVPSQKQTSTPKADIRETEKPTRLTKEDLKALRTNVKGGMIPARCCEYL